MSQEISTIKLAGIGTEIVEAATACGRLVRICGGIGYWLHCGDGREFLLGVGRCSSDLDLVADPGARNWIQTELEQRGWRRDSAYAAPFSHRYIYYRGSQERCDLYIGGVSECHQVLPGSRLSADAPTVPLAELLLEKLQNRQPRKEDFYDLQALLLEHDLGGNDIETINTNAVVKYTCHGIRGWGLFQTSLESLAALLKYTKRNDYLSTERKECINTRIRLLQKLLEETQKGLLWRLRALPGRRLRWYEQPDPTPRSEYELTTL